MPYHPDPNFPTDYLGNMLHEFQTNIFKANFKSGRIIQRLRDKFFQLNGMVHDFHK
jgi:hypothetical protein